ncbi:MAG: twin-arginine translocase TatA/TatE family subunit [Opitutaceae bacterium]|nr:twin-arginine translocase TatA/TatE family subunit [Opitutaceae bacterium]
MTSFVSILAVFGLGGPELLLILAVVLLLFGAKKLPELAKGLGRSVKEFKKASVEDDEDSTPKPAATVATETKKIEPVRTHGSN